MRVYLPEGHEYTIYETQAAAEAAAEVGATIGQAYRATRDANGVVQQTDLGWVILPPAPAFEDEEGLPL